MFADNNYYGHDRALQRYAGLDRPLPIPGRLLHGWTPEAGFAPAQLASRFPFLVWNRSNLDGCRERGARSVEAIGSPFLYHLHGKTLPPPTAAKRLLYVPFHSAEQARVQGATPLRERLDFLRAQGFASITICAYWHDFAQPEVRAAIAATNASSALRIATPVAETASTSSPFVLAMFSREPNSSRCAVPTLSTTAIDGGAIRASAAMFPR